VGLARRGFHPQWARERECLIAPPVGQREPGCEASQVVQGQARVDGLTPGLHDPAPPVEVDELENRSARVEIEHGLAVDLVDAIGRGIHRRQPDRRLLDHLDAAERLGVRRARGHLLDAAHQPVARTVEKRRRGVVLGGDGLRVQLRPQLVRTVVEGKRVVHGCLRPRFADVYQKHFAVPLPEHIGCRVSTRVSHQV